jgi:hypothetical protein
MTGTQPDFGSPDCFLIALAQSVGIADAEAAALFDEFERFKSWLMDLNPELDEIRLIGSITRGTRLSSSIDAQADLDCLLGVEQKSMFLDRKGPDDDLIFDSEFRDPQ